MNTQSISQLLKISLQHHNAGRLTEAAQGYGAILQIDPKHSDALHLMGVIAQQTDKLDLAIELMSAAAALAPNVAHYHHNLGNTYLKNGQPAEAVNCYRQAILLNSKYFEAHNGLGNALIVLNKLEAAAVAYKDAIRLQPSFAEAQYNLGRVLNKQGKPDEAIACYRKAIQIDPHNSSYFFNLGGVLFKQKDISGAIETYRTCIQLQPGDVKAHNNLGLALVEKGDLEPAIASYRQAIAVQPGYTQTYSNLGIAQLKLGKLSNAEQSCLKAIDLDPKLPEAHYNLGNILREQDRLAEAIEAYRRAMELSSAGIAADAGTLDNDPDSVHWQASNNLACTLDQQGNTEAALLCHQKAISLYPQNAVLRWNRSLIFLMHGNFTEGWEEYEWRWKMDDFPNKLRNCNRPEWRGEALHGEKILLYAEQGFGDTLQFVRYAPLVAAQGGEVILEVPPGLRRLLSDMPGVSTVISPGDTPPPDFSWHCPLMSLPLAFRTTMESIPAFSSYLQVPAEKILAGKQQWPGNRLRVGVAWAGNPKHIYEIHRSMHLRDFLPLSNLAQISFYSLQVGEATKQLAEVAPQFPVIDVCSQYTDFADTAAFLAGLDLVITVDTAIAHLAGALGIPVWILLAHDRIDWRWLRDREDSPWYPSARLFRQSKPGDWPGLMEKLRAALQELSENRTASGETLLVNSI